MKNICFLILIAYRYAIPNRHQQKSKFLSWFSIIGLIIGVSILVIVMSVMNGFERELKDRVVSISPHVKILNSTKLITPKSEKFLVEKIKSFHEVNRIESFIEKMCILSNNNQYHISNIIGLNFYSNDNINYLNPYIIHGNLSHIKEKYSISIGKDSAIKLGVTIGDKIKIILPDYKLTPMGYITREKFFKVTSIFSVGNDLDSNTMFINQHVAKNFFNFGINQTGFQINIDEYFDTENIYNFEKKLNSFKEIKSNYQIKNWREIHSVLFNAIYLEKTMIFILLLSVIAVASFNIISILLMNVIEKKKDISILKTLGFSSINIGQIFILQGLLIGFIGIIIGLSLGIVISLFINDILSFLESLFNQKLFDPSIYYISYLPTIIDYKNCLIISSVALFICLLASLYPAFIASKISPARALTENN